MAQALTEDTRLSSSSTGKIMNVVLWVLQIAAAGMVLNVGFLNCREILSWSGCSRLWASGSGSAT